MVKSSVTSKLQALTPTLDGKALILTEASIAEFFKPASEKEKSSLSWRTVDETLLVGTYRPNRSLDTPTGDIRAPKRRRIAGFDFVCATPPSLDWAIDLWAPV